MKYPVTEAGASAAGIFIAVVQCTEKQDEESGGMMYVAFVVTGVCRITDAG